MSYSTRRAGALALAAGAFLGALVTACGAILGFEELSPYPSEAGLTLGDGQADVATGDAAGPSGDATPDAPSCVGVDTTTNGANCGRCGHDCLGGTCKSSVCEPVLMADGVGVAEGIAVGATSVYVAAFDSNEILRIDKSSTGHCVGVPTPRSCVIADGTSLVIRPTAVGVDDARVYFANATGGSPDIRACPLTGCTTNQNAMLVASVPDFGFDHLNGGLVPLDLVVRDGLVFWPETGTGAIRSALADGGGGVATYLEVSSFMPLALVVDDTQIYFTDDTTAHGAEIQAVPRSGAARDGGAVRVVADLDDRPYGIALTAAGNLYFSSDRSGFIEAVEKTADGGKPIGALVTGLNAPEMVIADAANVYWVMPGDDTVANGSVATCPLTGCPGGQPIILARDQRHPRHIAQDATGIYWSNTGVSAPGADYDGQVWRVAKP